MLKKRITLQDIANEAGVSKATVSYVLNYSQKENISHETRIKVFAAAQKLKYVPNGASKSVSETKSHLAGIIVNIEGENKRSKVYSYLDFANELQRELYSIGYDMVLMLSKDIEKDMQISQKHSLDVVFLVDVDESSIKEITKRYYVPVILIDSFIDDSLFCKIVNDYDTIFKKAQELLGEKFCLAIEEYSSKYIMNIICNRLPEEMIFVNQSGRSLDDFFKAHENTKVLAIGEFLGMQIEKYIPAENLAVVVPIEKETMLLSSTQKIVVSNREKAKKAIDVMKNLHQINKTKEPERISLITPL